MRALSFELNYHWIDSDDYYHFRNPPEKQSKIVHKLLDLQYDSWAYEQHLYHIDFDRFHVSLEDQPNFYS